MEQLTWPDAEAVVIGYLATALAASAFSAATVTNVKPARSSLPLVLVRRAGGVAEEVFDRALVALQLWAATEESAADLTKLVRDLLRLMPTSVANVTRVAEFSGPIPVPDPDSNTPRYLLTVEATIRATARA